MRQMRLREIVLVLVVAISAAWMPVPATAQTLQLSRHADFSTSDALYSFQDTLFAKVTAPNINYLELERNEYRLLSANGASALTGRFNNNLNGTYFAYLQLSGLNRLVSSWEFLVEIRDKNGAEFKTSVPIVIQAVPGTGDSLNFIGRIDSLGANFLRLSGNTIFVDSRTDIRDENNQTLPFSALQNNWKVTVAAQRRSDNRIWALRIFVLERANEFEVETQGIIASIQGQEVTVNNIHFVVTSATEIIDHNGSLLTLADLRVGMLVQAKGKRNANGEVTALRIIVEDENPGGDEIVLTGKITGFFVDSVTTHKNFIFVDNTRFEVDVHTEILGFNEEPISLFDLRVGETVEIKARTRAGLVPLAERIKRQERDGEDTIITGTIVALGDSALTVGQLTFQVTPATIILDHENRFITFSDLRTGMLVEVRGNQQPGTNLVFATRIKVEDDDVDVIEIKGFIEALSSGSLTVLGVNFLVDDSTVVLDQNSNPIRLADLKVGMLVAVRADRRFGGILYATRIKIEDSLRDEIEIRGVITAKGAASLEVTGITFLVNSTTVIIDRIGNLIGFSELTVGMVAEIRAKRQNNQWLATRIQIADQVDPIVEIRGRIDSLDATGFIVLRRRVSVTNTTIVLDELDRPIRFSELRLGDFVEVRAQLLPNSNVLVALRVKRLNGTNREIEFSGAITVLSFTSITVGNIACQVNASTVYLDRNGQPIEITDLHLGMIVAVKARLESNGALVATQVNVEDRRSLSGVVSQLNGNLVFVQGLQHTLTASSLIYDALNQVTGAPALKVNQQVQLVARNENAQSEVVTLRIVSGGVTGVRDRTPIAPVAFELAQNHPNPFNPATVIRYSLPQAGFAQLAIYDLLGRRVRTLLDGVQPAGTQQVTWDSRDDTGRLVASGIYFYRLETRELVQTRRLLLMR